MHAVLFLPAEAFGRHTHDKDMARIAPLAAASITPWGYRTRKAKETAFDFRFRRIRVAHRTWNSVSVHSAFATATCITLLTPITSPVSASINTSKSSGGL